MQSFNNFKLLFLFVIFSIVLFCSFFSDKTFYYDKEKLNELKKYDFLYKLDLLESEIKEEKLELEKLTQLVLNFEEKIKFIHNKKIENNTIIPVIILVCNRIYALEFLLSKLIKIRPSSEKFPIYVSQDCDSEEIPKMISKKFQNDVVYIKHTNPLLEKINIEPKMLRYKTYFYISRHYKLILKHIFDKLNYEAAIILEDDLDISDDFFSFFNAVYHKLFKKDKTLYCISAWNDNGLPELIDSNNHDGLYRTDFFPGLGWLMSKDLWDEIGAQWPSGFWDDWIRKPEQRKNRMCIRPEISRTSMTKFGKKGASKGYFFDNYLKRVKLNDVSVDFNKIDMLYLTEKNYEKYYLNTVYNMSKVVSFTDFVELLKKTNDNERNFLRIEYITFDEYEKIAGFLKIMGDFKEGVGRTAYKGIISVYKNGWRIFIAPNIDKWKGYNRKWEHAPL